MDTVNIKELNERIQKESAFVDILSMEMTKVIVGQKHLVENLLIGLLANGHILLEGVPGLAKTLAINTLASCVNAKFSRIQFTPDLLPADLIGTMISEERAVPDQEGPCIRQLHTGRRDQPFSGQGAVRPPRGHAGASGDYR